MNTLLVGQAVNAADRARIEEHLGDCWSLAFVDDLDDGGLARVAPSVRAILGSRLPGGILDGATGLEVVQTFGTGIDGLDVDSLVERGVAILNTQGHSPLVAEHAVSLLLALARRLHTHDALSRAGDRWTPTGADTDALYESRSVVGSRVGFLGFGHVGRHVARLLQGFGVSCRATTRTGRQRPGDEVPRVPSDELVGWSDVIFVLLPLTASTRHFVDGSLLSSSAPGALWVHLSRWAVLDPDAVLSAMDEGRIGGLAIDHRFAPDDPVGRRLARLPNVLLSPYRATYAAGHRPHLDEALRHLRTYAVSGRLEGVVDPAHGGRP